MCSNGSVCKVTIDGVDFSIYEPSPFDEKWYSFKFNGPGVWYEVGLCIQTGWIVWINGPFPPGPWSDRRIARSALYEMLDRGEKFVSDRGYWGGAWYAETPTGLWCFDQKMKSDARSRHETVNSRFKRWSILERRFRHQVHHLHGQVFLAVANITQLQIETDEPLFQIEYNDRTSL